MLKKLKRKLRNLLLKKLFKAILEGEVLDFNNIDPKIKERYIQEAKLIEELSLWHALVKDIQFRCHKLMYEKSDKIEDIEFSKAMLYNIDVMDKTIKNLAKK